MKHWEHDPRDDAVAVYHRFRNGEATADEYVEAVLKAVRGHPDRLRRLYWVLGRCPDCGSKLRSCDCVHRLRDRLP